MMNDKAPFDMNGVLDIPQLLEKHYVADFFEKKGIKEEDMKDILTDFFFKFIKAMTDGDTN